MVGRKINCRINGEDYESFSAAARALGVSPATVLSAVERGTEHRIGIVKNGFMGFPSKREASIALGMHENYISRTLHEGSRRAIATMYERIEKLKGENDGR